MTFMSLGIRLRFQSTLPLRGATLPQEACQTMSTYFNPRSPCGERPLYRHCRSLSGADFNPRSPCGERRVGRYALSAAHAISIHAPLAGSDRRRMQRKFTRQAISIHAPLAGSDRRCAGFQQGSFHYNPRSPCGERLDVMIEAAVKQIFQSTLPLRGATTSLMKLPHCAIFQSTLPLRGATLRSYR